MNSHIESPTLQLIPTQEPQLTNTPVPTPAEFASVAPGLYLKIGNDGLITVTIPRAELGQGTHTALAMIVAEDLNAEWSTIRIEQAPGDPAFGDQTTGGSTSIQVFYNLLRMAGGVGCELMVRAAADTWSVDKSTCYAENNTVIHQPTGRRLAYWELVDKAGQMIVPNLTDLELKKPEQFRIIGTNVGRYENPQIVTGSAIFGLDVRLPGMLYATVARPPVLGGKLVKFEAAKAEKVALVNL